MRFSAHTHTNTRKQHARTTASCIARYTHVQLVAADAALRFAGVRRWRFSAMWSGSLVPAFRRRDLHCAKETYRALRSIFQTKVRRVMSAETSCTNTCTHTQTQTHKIYACVCERERARARDRWDDDCACPFPCRTAGPRRHTRRQRTYTRVGATCPQATKRETGPVTRA